MSDTRENYKWEPLYDESTRLGFPPVNFLSGGPWIDVSSRHKPKTFMIADLHLNHKNILIYEPTRLSICSNVESMNQALIDNWNHAVTNEDTVYFLGDFGLSPYGILKELCQKLQGSKHLIRGNHDRSITNKGWLGMGFLSVSKIPIEFEGFLLSHAPVMGSLIPNIHGHIHSKKLDSKKHFCVSVEQIGFTPISFEVIKEMMKGL